jgi:hypothetical protein
LAVAGYLARFKGISRTVARRQVLLVMLLVLPSRSAMPACPHRYGAPRLVRQCRRMADGAEFGSGSTQGEQR